MSQSCLFRSFCSVRFFSLFHAFSFLGNACHCSVLWFVMVRAVRWVFAAVVGGSGGGGGDLQCVLRTLNAYRVSGNQSHTSSIPRCLALCVASHYPHNPSTPAKQQQQQQHSSSNTNGSDFYFAKGDDNTHSSLELCVAPAHTHTGTHTLCGVNEANERKRDGNSMGFVVVERAKYTHGAVYCVYCNTMCWNYQCISSYITNIPKCYE